MSKWIEQIFDTNAFQAVKRITAITVDDEVHKKRVDVCMTCENYSNNIGQYCKICRCYVPVKTKLKNTTCPINKWN